MVGTTHTAGKGHNPQTEEMSTIVGMHNAVNEHTWQKLLGYSSNDLGFELGSLSSAIYHDARTRQHARRPPGIRCG